MTKSRFETVKKSGESRPVQRSGFQIDRKERRRQTQTQHTLSNRSIFILFQCIALHMDKWMTRQKFGQYSCGNSFAEHPKIKCSRSSDNLKSFVRIKECSLHVKDIPKECVVPLIGHFPSRQICRGDGVVFGNEHSFVARDDHARCSRAAAGNVFSVAVD